VGCARKGETGGNRHGQYGYGLFHFFHPQSLPTQVVSAGRVGARVLACHNTTPRPMIRPGT
jgi:hypothetical protein